MRAIALSTIAVLVAAATAATITGIEPTTGGVNGETRLTVSGTGFDIRGRSNDIFIGTGLNGVFCDPVPNECTDTRIVCLTDKYQGGPPLPLSVRSFGFLAACQLSTGCMFQYTHENTPVVSSISPEWAVAQDTITVSGSKFAQGDVTVGNFDFTMHLGEEERCELVGQVSSSAFRCLVHSMRPGPLDVDVIMGSLGRASLGSAASTLTLYPELQGFGPATGSIAGGTLVTLTGTSFSPELVENRVDIHGKPCVVTEVTEDRLTCRTAPSAVPTTTPARTWMAGKSKMEIWFDMPGNYIQSNWVDKLQYNQVSETRTVTGFDLDGFSCTNCAVRLTTHFVAPASGVFNFRATGDDEWELWIGTDEHPVVRRQELPANSSNVLDITPYNSRRCATGFYNNVGNCNRTLVAGQKYWMRGWLKQGSGGMGYSVTVTDAAGTAVALGSAIAFSEDWVPPVVIAVRDTPAKLADGCLNWGSCNFNYDAAATSTVTAVTATATPGSLITITGAGFDTSAARPTVTINTCADLPQCGGGGCACATASECANHDNMCAWSSVNGRCEHSVSPPCDTWSRNRVTVGGADCQVTSQSATELVCRLGFTAGAGTFPVVVRAGDRGFAAGSPLTTVTATIRKLAPAAGSINGGNVLTVLGHGFDAEDGVTSVTVGGTDCPITSIASFQITCIVPAGTVGNAAVAIATKDRVADTAGFSYTYSTAIVRPGITVVGGETTVLPRRASLGGGTNMRISVPSITIASTSTVAVTFGAYPCTTSFALNHYISCRTSGVPTPRTLTGTLTITAVDGTVQTVTLPSVSFVRSITALYNEVASPFGSSMLDIRYDGYPVPDKEVSVSAFGSPCVRTSLSNNRVLCYLGPKPTTAAALPVIEAIPFTVPTGSFTDPLYRMDYSTGVIANSDGSATIPGGASWLMTKRQVARPFVFTAKVRATRELGGNIDSSVVMRVCVTENSMAASGYRAIVADTRAGLFAIRGESFTSRTTTAQFAAGTNFASVGLDSTAYHNYKLVVDRQYISFYIDDILIRTVESTAESVGSVGFGHSDQTIRVRDLVIEDLYPQSLQVNVSGTPLWSSADAIWGSGPTISRFSPAAISMGSTLTIFGTSFGSGAYEVFSVASATAQIERDSPRVCSGSVSTTSTGTQYFTCTVGSVPAGSLHLVFRSSWGMAETRGTAIYTALVTAISPNFGGSNGKLVTVSGAGFATGLTARIGGNACEVLTINDEQFVCMAPAGSGSAAALTVTSGGAAATVCRTCTFNYNLTAPEITAVSTSTGGDGTSITFTGTNFETDSASWVRAGVVDCSDWSRTSTLLKCTMARSATTGAKPLVVHFPQAGRATFAAGVTTTFTFQTQATGVSPSSGSVNGGQTLRIDASNIDTSVGVTRVEQHTFTSAAQGWSGMPDSLWTCNGRSMMGPFQQHTTSKTFAGLAAHQAIRVAYDITLVSSNAYVVVDGQRFLVPKTDCEYGWVCGSSWMSTCRATGSVILPHTAASATVSFVGSQSNNWGVISYDIGTVATIQQVVTIGGNACPVTVVDPSNIYCTTPAGSGSATVAVTSGSTSLCSGCSFTYQATATPTVAVMAASEMPGVDAATRPLVPQLAIKNGVRATYTNDGARVWKLPGTTSGWNGLASSPLPIARPTTGTDGIAFIAAGACPMMFGLASSKIDESGSYTGIDFALYLTRDGTLQIYEDGTYRGEVGDYRKGDTFAVYYDSSCSCVKYAQNGAVVYQSDAVARFPLYMAGSLYDSGCVGIDHLKFLQPRPAMSRLVFSGSALTPSGTPVTVGGSACLASYVSTNVANCWVASLPTGNVNVVASSSLGAGSSVSVAITAATFSGASDSTGSTEGGHTITIYGSGFGATTTVSIGSQCTVSAWTSTSLECKTSANTAGTQVMSVTTGATTHTCLPYMGIVGASATTCSYTYSAPSAAVTGIAGTLAAGNTITVTGTGFASGSAVYLGDFKCPSVTFTTTSITCTIAAATPAGSYNVVVVNPHSGASTSTTTAQLPLTVSAVSTNAIGNAGGARITFTGANFGMDGSSVAGVTAGSTNACASITRTSSQIVCTTAAFDHSGSLILTVNGVTHTVASFSSAAGNVPTIASVQPTSGGAGSAITATGTNLEGTGAIVVGGVDCVVYASTATSASCILAGGAAAGSQAVTVRTDNRGTGTGSASFNVRLMVGTVTPSRGPNAGGRTVTITGSGFSTDIAKMRVRIAGATCVVSSSAATAIVCVTGAVALDNNRTDVTVAMVDTATSTTTASATQYAFSTSLTATIVSVTPSAGSAAGLEMLTVVGTGFSTNALENVIRIGGVDCPVQTVATDGTSATCLTQPMPFGTHNVDVIINQQGRATQPSTPVAFTANFHITSVSGGSSFSVEGGALVTFIGTGFWTFDKTSWQHGYYNLTVGTRPCAIESATATEVRCRLPAAPRPFVKIPTLVNAYPLKPEATNVAVALAANGKVANVASGVVINYAHSATPRVTSVSPSGTVAPGTTITLNGNGFAASGNKVWIGDLECPVAAESTTQVTCTVGASSLGAGFIRVNVPGKGESVQEKTCPSGESLMCDGSCIGNSKCIYEEWGMATCSDLANVIVGETFCHANGGTDRVNIPFTTDTKTVFNMNCPMYSCEGGDCDQALYIGGRGGRISTCGADPTGTVIDVRPTISALSTSSSSIGGGKMLTITGNHFGTNTTAVVVTANNAVCAITQLSATSIVCETGSQVRSTSAVAVFVSGVRATCASTTCSFMYTDLGIPTVSNLSPSNPRAGRALTITGTNFGTTQADVTVHIGSRVCAVTEVTATSVTCTAPQMPIGSHALRVNVASIGSSFGAVAPYALYVASISQGTGSINGGHRVSIVGSGFSAATTARFGADCVGKFVAITDDKLVVETPACAAGTQRVYAIQNGAVSSCDGSCTNYVFSATATPEITASNVNGNTVTLTVSNIAATSVQADITVMAGAATCAVTAFSATSVTCTMSASHQGVYAIRITDANRGSGPTPSATAPTFTFASSVSGIAPTSGARGGEQALTITGSGFGTSAANNAVMIGTEKCAISTITNTQIVCTTAQTSQSGAVAVTVTAVDSRMIGAAAVATSPQQYTYDPASPTITSVAPNRGSTAGGTSLTIGGTSLSSSLVVTIDGQTCAQSAAQAAATTATTYFCTTAAHRTLLMAVPVKAAIPSNGGIAHVTAKYQYIDLWSRWTTWGNTPPPVEGDSAVISEGQSVMIDYSPPRFYLIIVMGHLLFDNEINIDLHCTYIMINFGRFTVGTPEAPYLKKAVITLHGDRLTPEIPVHGAKVIALRHGALDMHGEVRMKTWTHLAATANAGASTIQVRGPVDWRVGEFIVVAPTDYEFLHAEERMITGIVNANTDVVTIMIEYPLAVQHYGERQCFSNNGADEVCVDEIAEVGLLTRNIVVKGDKDSMRIGFGGTMFLMPLGQNADMYARLSYVEFAQCGQMFIVGRYPVHYHVTGSANNSYVNGTAVHESLNRAFSIHGVHNNTYINNVAYNILGHAFFIEDGSERFNRIEHNMVSVVKSTTSNLNTDVTPANFWIVSPTNIIKDNAACGGHAYGFWISPFHPHSTGPTHSETDCPASHQLTEFSGNTAHSNRKYGINIFRYWWPKAVECDFNSADVPAYIRNHLSYKNHIHGITMGNQEAGEVGSIIIDNYTAADNGFVHGDASAYWIEKNRCANQTIGIQNSRLIALTNNNPYRRSHARRGINLPEGDNFFTENVTFVNYDNENFGFEPQAWAERMSHCFPWGWDALSRGLKWVNSPKRIRMRFHHHGVLYDDDGTLTGTARTQILAKSPLFDDTICTTVPAGATYLSETLVCPEPYKIRRFGISTMNEIFTWQMWINGNRREEVCEILRGYLVTAPINHSIGIDFQWWKNPAVFDWKFGAFKFLQPGERMSFWTIYNETRHHVYGTYSNTGLNRTWWGPNPTMGDATSNYNFNNVTMNFTGLLTYPQNTKMTVSAFYCPDEGCAAPPLAPGAWDQPCRSFTSPSSWTAGAVPGVGAELFIRSAESVCMDGLATPATDNAAAGGATDTAPIAFPGACTAGRVYQYNFFNMRIEGSLQLLDHHCPCDGAVVHLNVESNVWIRNGGILIGNETNPLTRCKFRLSIGAPPFGDVTRMANYRLDPWAFRSLTVESGMLRLHGAKPQPLWARLRATAAAGSTTLNLDQAVNWTPGQKLAIAGTTRLFMFHESATQNDEFEESEKHEIAAVAADRMSVTLTRPLVFAHYGSGPKTLGNRTHHIGAEVIILDRKICLDGGVDDRTEPAFGAGWKLNAGCTEGNHEGCAIGVAGVAGFPMIGGEKPGFLQIDGALFQDMGQAADLHGSVELDGLIDRTDAGGSYLRNSAFDRMFNTGIFIRDTTTGMTIQNNTFFNVSGDAIRTGGPGNTIDGNVIIRLNTPIQVCDKVYFIFWDCRTAGIRAHAGTRVINNVVASGMTAGYMTDGDLCTGNAMQWANNYAHSTRDGLLVAEKPAELFMNWKLDASVPSTCRHVGGVTAYWIGDHGLVNWYAPGDFVVSDVTVVEATVGMTGILMYPPANVVGQAIPTARYTNLAFAGHWDGMGCRGTDWQWTCKKSLLDSAPWCKLFHTGHNQQLMGTTGLGETLFTSSEFGMSKTKGEQKFRWMEMDSFSTVGGQVIVNGIHFSNFNGNDACGLKNVGFHQSPYSNDTFHHHQFSGVSWNNIQNGGEVYMRTMYGDTHHPADDFTDTWYLDYDNFKYGAYWPDSPNHQLLIDVDGTFTGTGRRSSIVASQTLTRTDKFSRLGYNGRNFRNLGPMRAGCVESERTRAWNAVQCDSSIQWLSVIIDNLSEDRLTRRPGPVVMCKGDGMIDVNGWPLCQGGQVQYASGPVMKSKAGRAILERMTRYWFHAENNGNLTLNFRGQPPENMRLYLQDHEYLGVGNNAGVTLNLRYHGLNSQLRVGVYVNGVRQRPVVGYGYPQDQSPAQTWPAPTDPAGTHYHDKYVNGEEYTSLGNQGVQRNVLSFVLRPGAVVDLRQEPIVQVTAQLSMPVDEFFNNKDTFPAAMAAALGIPADRMKFAKIVPGTTRRRAGGSTTTVELHVQQSDSAASANFNGAVGAESNDLAAVAARVTPNITRNSNLAAWPISSIEATVVKVAIPVPEVNVAYGTPYVLLNVSKNDGGAINATVMEMLVEAFAKTTMNVTVAAGFNVTERGDVVMSNVHTSSSTGHTRMAMLMLYENATLSFQGLEHLARLLANSSTSTRVLPGYTIHGAVLANNGFGSSSSGDSLWGVEGSVLKFAVGVAVGLIAVCIIGAVVIYCCIYKRTAKLNEREEQASQKQAAGDFEGVPQKPAGENTKPPTHSPNEPAEDV